MGQHLWHVEENLNPIPEGMLEKQSKTPDISAYEPTVGVSRVKKSGFTQLYLPLLRSFCLMIILSTLKIVLMRMRL